MLLILNTKELSPELTPELMDWLLKRGLWGDFGSIKEKFLTQNFWRTVQPIFLLENCKKLEIFETLSISGGHTVWLDRFLQTDSSGYFLAYFQYAIVRALSVCPRYYFPWGWPISLVYGSIDSLWPKDSIYGRTFFWNRS